MIKTTEEALTTELDKGNASESLVFEAALVDEGDVYSIVLGDSSELRSNSDLVLSAFWILLL